MVVLDENSQWVNNGVFIVTALALCRCVARCSPKGRCLMNNAC
jgi:hypothetical protein